MNRSLYRLGRLATLLTAVACTTPKNEIITPDGPPATTGKKPVVVIKTVFGTDTKKGFADGNGTKARFEYPNQMAIDKNDNLYVIDQLVGYYGGSVIRKIDPAGNVTTFAKGLTAATDLCVDPRDGTTIYAVENGDSFGVRSGLYRITSNGQVTRLSNNGGKFRGYQDGPLASAVFDSPTSIAMDKKGNLYVGDALNKCIRKVDLNTNMVSTFAGEPIESAVCQFADGKGRAARFCNVDDLTFDDAGNLFVPDWGNHSVRKITPDGTVSTYLGLSTGYTPDGPRTKYGVYQPYRVQFDLANKQLFIVVDTGGGIKMVTADDYVYGLGRYITSTDYADNSPGSQHGVYSMAVNRKGELFTLDRYNHCIRKWTITWK